MPPSHLRIDTSVTGYAGPSSGRGLPSSSLRSAKSEGRLRSASTSSSTSAASHALSKASSSTKALSPHWASSFDNHTPSAHESDSADEASGSPEYVLAMHDFAPQHQNETCLAFRAGQVIHVLNRDSSGWWDGELDGRRGWFPSNYVTSDVGLLSEEELPKINVCVFLCLSRRAA